MHVFALKKISIPEQHRLTVAVTVSIVFHLLLLLGSEAGLLEFPALTGRTELLQPVPEDDPQLVFRIVESDPLAETDTPPEDTRNVSDKTTKGMDVTEFEDPGTALPYPQRMGGETGQENQSQVAEFLKRQPQQQKQFDLGKLGIMTAEEKKPGEDEKTVDEQNQQSLLAHQQDANARNLGGFTLSTYEWEFAPYMLELKRTVEKNIYPPTAFFMGMISGTYVVQFTVTRGGEIVNLKVLDSKGNKALETTSLNAIKYSSPLRPLPGDFPDNVLIVTGTFLYNIIR